MPTRAGSRTRRRPLGDAEPTICESKSRSRHDEQVSPVTRATRASCRSLDSENGAVGPSKPTQEKYAGDQSAGASKRRRSVSSSSEREEGTAYKKSKAPER